MPTKRFSTRSRRSLRVCAVKRRRFPVGERVTKYGDRASVQAATRVNAEQASHDAVQVKGPHQGSIDKPPVAFGIAGLSPICMTRPDFRARSTSHTVAAHDGCTKIPLAAHRAQEDENHSRKRRLRPWLASVRPPGSARKDQVLEDDGILFGVLFVNGPSSWRLR